ncbi:MAG TPA: CdaR family protein [Candidatus Dormibacteraeota bacterium]
MSWVTDSWRLKLLAIGLSILMLGAVAFAQNPPTFKTLTASISYVPQIPDNLIVINGPSKTTVRVTGLADPIQAMTASSLTASFDLSKAAPGPAVKVNLIVTAGVQGVTVQNPSVPYFLDIEPRKTVPLTVHVRFLRVAQGWQVTKFSAGCPNSPCVVNFEGPVSWETKLVAYADIGGPIQNEGQDFPNMPITLEQAGTPLDVANFLRTTPNSSLSPAAAEVQYTAKTSTTSKQVVLMAAQPSHLPPPAYQLTAITFSPELVLVKGRADILANVTALTLPAADLSGHTSTFTVSVAIPYPAGVSGPAGQVRVTYTISPNPAVQASPTPTASP